MYLCTRCRLQQSLHGPFRSASLRFQSSKAAVAGKAPRLQDLVILATPKASPPEKKKKKAKSSAAVHQAKASILAQDIKSLWTNVETSIDNEDVFKFLDGLKIKYQHRGLNPIKYKSLVTTLQDSFSARQLRAYLQHSKVSHKRKKASQLGEAILKQVWNTARRDFRGSSHNKSLQLTNEALYFLLADSGKLLQTWSFKHKLRVEINKSTREMIMHGTVAKIDGLEAELEDLSRRLATKTVHIDIPPTWSPDEELMRRTNTFIDSPTKEQIRIFYMTEDPQSAEQAERLVLESIRFHSTRDEPVTSLTRAKEGPVRSMPVHIENSTVAESRFSWMRDAALFNGIVLPSYHLYSREPKPLKSSQVIAKPVFDKLPARATLADGAPLTDLLNCSAEAAAVHVTFGHVLSTADSMNMTFSSNIPGQFHVIRNHELVATEEKDYRLLLSSMGHSRIIDLSVSLLNNDAEEAIDTSQPHSTILSAPQTYVKCPAQPCDLLVQHSAGYEVPAETDIRAFLADANIEKGEVPPTITIEGQVWRARIALVTTMNFRAKQSEDDDIMLQWQKFRFPGQLEKFQQLRLVGTAKAEPDRFLSAVAQVYKDLRRV